MKNNFCYSFTESTAQRRIVIPDLVCNLYLYTTLLLIFPAKMILEQEKYTGYFQNFIQKQLNKNRNFDWFSNVHIHIIRKTLKTIIGFNHYFFRALLKIN